MERMQFFYVFRCIIGKTNNHLSFEKIEEILSHDVKMFFIITKKFFMFSQENFLRYFFPIVLKHLIAFFVDFCLNFTKSDLIFDVLRYIINIRCHGVDSPIFLCFSIFLIKNLGTLNFLFSKKIKEPIHTLRCFFPIIVKIMSL